MNSSCTLEKTNPITLLHNLTVRNEDNGSYFINPRRLEQIDKELENSTFTYYSKGNLFHAYAQVPFEELPEKILVISSHVDFKRATRDCFSDETHPEFLVGTYDNSITNAAIVALMTNAALPPNTVVVFTGDEEEDQGGAREFMDFMKDQMHHKVKCLVLDVTESGNEDGAIFTIENDCWNKKWGRRVLTWANGKEMPWKYVPYQKSRLHKELVQELVDKEHCIPEEADVDETTVYYEKHGVKCFSFCIPVMLEDPEGHFAPWREGMHSEKGLRVRKEAYEKYIQALYEVIWVTYKRPEDVDWYK